MKMHIVVSEDDVAVYETDTTTDTDTCTAYARRDMLDKDKNRWRLTSEHPRFKHVTGLYSFKTVMVSQLVDAMEERGDIMDIDILTSEHSYAEVTVPLNAVCLAGDIANLLCAEYRIEYTTYAIADRLREAGKYMESYTVYDMRQLRRLSPAAREIVVLLHTHYALNEFMKGHIRARGAWTDKEKFREIGNLARNEVVARADKLLGGQGDYADRYARQLLHQEMGDE